MLKRVDSTNKLLLCVVPASTAASTWSLAEALSHPASQVYRQLAWLESLECLINLAIFTSSQNSNSEPGSPLLESRGQFTSKHFSFNEVAISSGNVSRDTVCFVAIHCQRSP